MPARRRRRRRKKQQQEKEHGKKRASEGKEKKREKWRFACGEKEEEEEKEVWDKGREKTRKSRRIFGILLGVLVKKKKRSDETKWIGTRGVERRGEEGSHAR